MKKSKRTKRGGTWRPGKPGRPPKARAQAKENTANAMLDRLMHSNGFMVVTELGPSTLVTGALERVLYVKHLGELLDTILETDPNFAVLEKTYRHELGVLCKAFGTLMPHIEAAVSKPVAVEQQLQNVAASVPVPVVITSAAENSPPQA